MPSDQRRGEMSQMLGMPPGMATLDEFVPHGDERITAQISHGPGGRASRSGKLNLRAVADVLETYGLDPIEEIAKAIVAQEPVVQGGQPVLDQDGKPLMKPVLNGDVRLRSLLELAQYSRPKLKAVEVTTKAPELTDEQIDRRLEALITRTGK